MDRKPTNTSFSKHNTEKEKKYLIAGTITIALDNVAYRISKQGSGNRRIVRWSSITITGKQLQTLIYTCIVLSVANPDNLLILNTYSI